MNLLVATLEELVGRKLGTGYGLAEEPAAGKETEAPKGRRRKALSGRRQNSGARGGRTILKYTFLVCGLSPT